MTRGSWIGAVPVPPQPSFVAQLESSAGSSLVGFIQDGIGASPRTVQDKLRQVFDVRDFGAVGDGITDDSAAVTRAITIARANFLASGEPQTIWWPKGFTFVLRLVVNKPGVDHYSDGAVILKTPAGAITDQNVLKNWRMITHSQSDFATDLDLSHRVTFDGLIFDGNLANMNWPDNTYSQEQAHCLFLIGNSAPSSVDRRAKFAVRNCVFKNSVADGVSQYYNTDLIAQNIIAANCFRGGFTSTGGNSQVILRGYKGENARFDIEVDGAGYGGTFRLDSDIDGVTIDQDGGGLRPGGIDIGYYDGGTFVGNNIKCFTSPSNFLGSQAGLHGKRMNISQSFFTFGQSSGVGNRFVKPIQAEFHDTTFFVSNDNVAATAYDGIQITFDLGSANVFNESILLDGCRFRVDPTVDITKTRGIYSPTNIAANANKIVVRNADIDESFAYGVYCAQGGSVKWDGGRVNAQTAFWMDYSGTTRFFTLDVGQISLGSNCTSYLKSNTALSATGNTLIHRGTIIDDSLNAFSMSSTGDVANITGGRIIMSAAAPSAKPGYKGDVYRLKAPAPGSPYEWVATNAAYAASATWRAVKWSAAKNTTANRPTLGVNDVGVQYLDTTLAAAGKPINWTGTAWVDGTGAVV